MSAKKFQTAVIHFGADKTGSSSIQAACNMYRDLLQANGVYYPSGVWHNELASCVSVHPENEIANVVYGYTDIHWIQKRDTEYLNNLCDEINRKEGKYLIFSNENFSFLDQKAIENLYEFALQFAEECKIFIYVRSPESYAISGISQRVKMGFDPWEPLPIANVFHVLNALEKTCSKDKIIVRLFDRQMLFKGDVVADFLSFFELDTTLIELISENAPKENTSLSLEAKIIGEKIIHQVAGQKLTSLAFMKKFQNILESIEGQKTQLTQVQAELIKNITRGHTDYLKRKFNIVFPASNHNYQTSVSTISDETAASIAKIIVDLISPEHSKGQNKTVISSEFQLRHAILKEGYDIVHGQSLCFEVEFAIDREIAELEAGIHIWDSQERWAFGVNSTLQKEVMYSVVPGIYRISHYVVADLPEGVYTAGFAFAEKLSNGSSNELMWYDKLCEFRVSQPSGRVGVGYANLPSTQMLTKIRDIQKIANGAGRIVPVSIPSKMKPSETLTIDVEVYNDTNVIWRGDPFKPVRLSYHWFDENDNVIVFDGVRTPLSDDGILAYGRTLTLINIIAPEEEGTYKLMLTMVQESVNWFENIGFKPYNVMIEIKN